MVLRNGPNLCSSCPFLRLRLDLGFEPFSLRPKMGWEALNSRCFEHSTTELTRSRHKDCGNELVAPAASPEGEQPELCSCSNWLHFSLYLTVLLFDGVVLGSAATH